MATAFILSGLGLLATATATGFAFAGGASAFQEVKKDIGKLGAKREDTQEGAEIHKGEPKRARDQNPFNDTRFLSDVEKKEISQLLKKDPVDPAV